MRVILADSHSNIEQGQSLLRKIPVIDGWGFKQSSDIKPIATDGFLPVAQFPTVVQLDLLANGLIPDPYIGTNEVYWQSINIRVECNVADMVSGSSG